MMRIGGHVRCSPLFILLALFAALSENAVPFLMHMGALTLHELAHSAMALLLGCGIRSIDLLPYGCRMEISQMDSPADELTIALAGPVFSVVCYMGSRFIPGAEEFARANMYIALINLMPAYPLDGGRAANAMLSLAGIKTGRLIRSSTALILAAATGICGYMIKNMTLIIFSIFLVSEGIYQLKDRENNIRTQMKNIRAAASGRGIGVRHIALRKDVSLAAALSFAYAGYTVYYILDENMQTVAMVEGPRLMQLAAEKGGGKCLGDIIPSIDRSKY